MDNSAKTNAEIVKQRWTFTAEQRSLLVPDCHVQFSKTWVGFMEGINLTKFATAVNLVEFLTTLEAKCQTGPDAQLDLSDVYLSAFLNAEYLLLRLFGECEDLQYNPFLLHWVKVVKRWQPVAEASMEDCQRANIPLWMQALHQARLEIVKCALGLVERSAVDALSPHALLEQTKDKYKPIKLDEFITILQSQGLYPSTSDVSLDNETSETSSATHDNKLLEMTTSAHPVLEETNGNTIPTSEEHPIEENPPNQLSASDQQLHEFDDYFLQQPWDAINALIRLPPDLASLDLVTRVLTDEVMREALKLYHFQLEDIVREHLQHALLCLERLQANEAGQAAGNGNSSSSSSRDMEGREGGGGKAEVERMASLLTIYLRSILPRGLVSVDTIYLDISELCTRYIWIAAVREFKVWFENAVGGASAVDVDDGAVEGSQVGLSMGG